MRKASTSSHRFTHILTKTIIPAAYLSTEGGFLMIWKTSACITSKLLAWFTECSIQAMRRTSGHSQTPQRSTSLILWHQEILLSLTSFPTKRRRARWCCTWLTLTKKPANCCQPSLLSKILPGTTLHQKGTQLTSSFGKWLVLQECLPTQRCGSTSD